jgi:hypothetical protein
MEEFFSGCGTAKTPVSMACDVRSMVIRPSYCKGISRYAAHTRLLGLVILQGRFVYATELGSLGWSRADLRLRRGCVRAEEEGRLCLPLAHLLGAYIAIRE